MTKHVLKLLSIFWIIWLTLNSKVVLGQLSLEDYFSEEEGGTNHNLWIKPKVQIVKNWKSGGRLWSGPWNYEALGGQLFPGLQCWYCNIWFGTRYHLGPVADSTQEKCIATGKTCDGSEACCDPNNPKQGSDDLCDLNLKKCVACIPTLRDKCRGLFKKCCEKNEDVFCLPRQQDEDKEPEQIKEGICQLLPCEHKPEASCNATRDCCPTLECRSGKCVDCAEISCRSSNNGGCCESYNCPERRGNCRCEKIGFHCSQKYPCCPPTVCSSTFPVGVGDFFVPSHDAYDPICAERSNCAKGRKPCPKGKVCVNDVCVRSCIGRGLSCGGDGDSRECCKGDRCQTSCKNSCAKKTGRYCSAETDDTSNCNCEEFAVKRCHKNGDCRGGTCCVKEPACKYQGNCKKLGKSNGKCLFGDNAAITYNQNGKYVVECPKKMMNVRGRQ